MWDIHQHIGFAEWINSTQHWHICLVGGDEETKGAANIHPSWTSLAIGYVRSRGSWCQGLYKLVDLGWCQHSQEMASSIPEWRRRREWHVALRTPLHGHHSGKWSAPRSDHPCQSGDNGEWNARRVGCGRQCTGNDVVIPWLQESRRQMGQKEAHKGAKWLTEWQSGEAKQLKMQMSAGRVMCILQGQKGHQPHGFRRTRVNCRLWLALKRWPSSRPKRRNIVCNTAMPAHASFEDQGMWVWLDSAASPTTCWSGTVWLPPIRAFEGRIVQAAFSWRLHRHEEANSLDRYRLLCVKHQCPSSLLVKVP